MGTKKISAMVDGSIISTPYRYFVCEDDKGHFVKQNEIVETDKDTWVAPRVTINDIVECRDEFKSDDASNRHIAQKCQGTIQCVVSSQNDPNCIYYGIQLDEPHGHSDGTFENTQFWKTKPNHAAFVKAEDDILWVHRESKDKWIKVKRGKQKTPQPVVDKGKKKKSKLGSRSKSHDTSVYDDKKPKAKIKNRKFAKDDVKLDDMRKEKRKKKKENDVKDGVVDGKKKKKKIGITISDADADVSKKDKLKKEKVNKKSKNAKTTKSPKNSLSVPTKGTVDKVSKNSKKKIKKSNKTPKKEKESEKKGVAKKKKQKNEAEVVKV